MTNTKKCKKPTKPKTKNFSSKTDRKKKTGTTQHTAYSGNQQEKEDLENRISIGDDGIVANRLSRHKGRFLDDITHLINSAPDIFINLSKAARNDRTPYSKPINVLNRAVYQLGRDLLEGKNSADRLAKYLNKAPHDLDFRKIKSNAPDPIHNPFFWFFHILVREKDTPENERFVSSSQRKKLSKELLYAHKNDVPPEYLTGFILQVGRARVVQLCDAEDWDGWKTIKKEAWTAPGAAPSTHSPETQS